MTLQKGDRFDHYEIRSHIAQGGTGDVYRAMDITTGREIALKIPMRSTVLDPSQYEYFLREVEAMRILEHPAVQHGLESGRFEATPYLATDLVSGSSIRTLLSHNGPFAVDETILLIRKIAEGLAYCHQQDVIHRDIKPENILIADNHEPVIVDFGLAISKARPGLGKIAGTLDYVAPEQIEGQPCDQRTDIYSLGAMLYEMLVGTAPFIGKDAEEVIRKHLYAAVPRLDEVNPEFTLQLATVVAKCLQRSPQERYADMQALIHDLDHLASVDTRQLGALTAVPPGEPFFKTQFGQIFLMLGLFVVGTLLITLLAVSIRSAH